MAARPNVIVLLIDTARAQSFSAYGYERPTSPHFDALAREGVLYEQAIAPGCWSLPSQVSLLTGLFPSKHGAHELHLSYAHAYPLLPEVLRQAGYHTLGVSPNSWMSDEFGVTHGFDVYLKLWQCWPTLPAPPPPNWRLRAAVVKRLNRLYSRYVFSWRNRARHVTRHIRRLLARAPEPFFLYAIYWDMHLPYYPRRQDAERWLPAGMTYRQAQRVNRNHLRYLTGQVAMDEEDFAVLRALYDGALAAVDAEIGALVAWLRRQGLLERTLLIITSDHGENLGDHGLMSHAYSLHDTLIRVPLLIRYPPCFPAGTRFPAQVQLTDLFPTVLDVVGLDVPHVRQALQGLSLLEADAAAWAARPAYAEMLAPHPSIRALNRRAGLPEDTPRPEFDRALRCVRLPDVKLVWASDGRHALYDLRQDPHETQNRFHQEPELAAALLDLLARWQPTTPASHAPTLPEVDQAVRRRLRALGYLE